jgi:hypothetical protein
MLTRAQIEEVRRLDGGGAPIVSFYLSLDKQNPGENFSIRSKNMLRYAFDQTAHNGSHAWTESIRADSERIYSFLEDRHAG